MSNTLMPSSARFMIPSFPDRVDHPQNIEFLEPERL